MTRRARGLAAPSRVLVALLVAALALAAAMAGGYDAVYAQTVDYDDDNDGLIDVRSLAQLNVIRHDTNGDGDVAAGAGLTAYNAAFPNRVTTSSGRMGCPSGTCSGYELRADLDFDTDGDGSTYTGTGANAAGDMDDAYYNGGMGWQPSGLGTTFRGNGYIISNLFIKRTTSNDLGLFSSVSSSARVESLGLKNAFVHGKRWVGAIAGFQEGRVVASWTSGAIRGERTVGGLVGSNLGTGRIIACYSHASAHASLPAISGATLGGLSGYNNEQAHIIASYATGLVTTSTSDTVGGLLGENDAGTVTNSYYDTSTVGGVSGPGTGQTTSALQTPTGYTGIYANWNVDVDGATGNDNPWNFGTSSQYPALRYGGHDPADQIRRTFTDYDDDNDGLIDVRSLAQLNAIRHDTDGNGDVATGAPATAYNAAFPERFTGADGRMGCPSGTCTGYELRAHLDFDTDRDGAAYTGSGADAAGDPGDTYYNAGAGWLPIGGISSTFKGNGYTISNLFIKRAATNSVGLFSSVGSSGRVESLGVRNAFVHGKRWVGAVAGFQEGRVVASWSSGAIRGERTVGGLIGANNGAGRIIACYSRASAHASDPHQSSGATLGGLTGYNNSQAHIIASYSTGALSSTVALTGANRVGGLVGENDAGAVTNSYYDSQTSGVAAGAGAQTTSALQTPTGYTAGTIYANWNVNVDGTTGNDDPWDFGTSSEYPALKFGGHSAALQRAIDYDEDNDGLIEIATLAQLNAVRHDLNGDGDVAAGAPLTAYDAAFPKRAALAMFRMGCPAGTCSGYELAAHLDFDTDEDGSTYTGTGAAAASDPQDDYHNGGMGWEPIGTFTNKFTATFKGNGYVISNLFISRTATSNVALFGALAGGGRIESVGLKNAYVNAGSTGTFVGALVGDNRGTVAASWSDGAVRGSRFVGGLAGYNTNAAAGDQGAIIASYSHASAHASATTTVPAPNVGGLAGVTEGGGGRTATIAASYSTGAVTAGAASRVAGLTNTSGSTSIANSFWDSTASGISDDGDDASPEGVATDGLQSVLGYAAGNIYANWNVNVDGVAGNDDPWDFGTALQYPALKFGGMNPYHQRSDYDGDNDGLIDITTLAQLDAVRRDLNGDGTVAAGADLTAYNAAFPFRTTASGNLMGCPSGTCSGYELAADLDFDTDGDGSTYSGTGDSAASDSGDDYHNGGNGFEPIGNDSGSRFDATFKGNGFTISNLFIKRTGMSDIGLFGAIDATARVESLGVKNAYVNGQNYVGIIAGDNYGTIAASWTSGVVRGDIYVGGLVGYNIRTGAGQTGDVIACYSRASVHAEPQTGSLNAYAGGLVGRNGGASAPRIIASYSTGTVVAVSGAGVGGFLGNNSGGTVTASYWDSTTSAVADDSDTTAPEGVATADLQTVLGYEGIYAGWNVNVDGATGADDPWDFGGAGAYPALKFGGMNPAKQRAGDYDQDGDGLIEIANLAQLDAMRRDLNGDGDSTHDDYVAVFPERTAPPEGRMGCRGGTCGGYELIADLDFDTNGNGATYAGPVTNAISDSGDAYHNGGEGFEPIGADTSAAARFNTTFKGNGYTISNLFIKRTTASSVGLFGAVHSGARIESVGVKDAFVHGQNLVGALVGRLYGPVTTSWVSGEVLGARWSGGFAGQVTGGASGSITASYSRANFTSSGSPGTEVGGLLGEATANATVSAVYSTGTVTSTGGGNIGGLIGAVNSSATIEAAYWDTATTGRADDADSNMPEGRTTAQLQAPTDYAGIYAGWNANVDGAAGDDDPWDFGGAGAYPRLRYGGMNPEDQRFGDYDQDGDGLIEITTLAQLDAMRYDLNGNGDATDAEYAAAFPSRITAAAARMGCPSGACTGYELAAHLDFDTDGDGSTYTGSGDSATGDSGDAYYNGGEGWVNLGGSGSGRNFDTTFRGNGYTIANLFIKRTGAATAGLFGTISPSARIESVGVVDGYVYGGAWSGILVGTNFGTVAGSYTTGEVLVTLYTGGGLVGLNNGDGGNTGEIIASYSHANVAAGGAGSASDMGGLAGFVTRGSKITASYSTGTVTTTGGNRAGFMSGGSTIAASDIEVSYWDTTTTNIADDGDSDMPEGVSSVNLKSPTGYTGIYANWNVDVDGTTGNDDPWHFGGTSTYPALKYGGHDPYRQTGDYDTDDDGLIEIWTPDRLNAVRWDLDGDAVQDATSAADWAKRGAAFPNALPSLGCPDTAADADSDPGPCTGYELARDLDFTDANGDGEAGVDRVYRYWTPIGSATSAFSGTFDGNNKTVSPLKIEAEGAGASIGLFANSSGTVMKTGLPDVDVRVTGGDSDTHIGALLGEQSGRARGNWSTGTVTQTGGSGGDVGGLIGYSSDGDVTASWSGAHVTSSAASAKAGGLIGSMRSALLSAVYSTGVVMTSGAGAYAGGLAGELRMPVGSGFSASYATGPATKTGTGGAAGALYGTASSNSATITAVYWDTGTTGYAAGAGTQERGYGTMALSMPEAYGTGIYANWNVNVDAQAGADDPWDFGRNMQYPMLKWGGMSVVRQGSLAMGMAGYSGDYPKVGQNANVCLVDGPAMRASGSHNGKDPWQWQRSADGKTWTDITYDPAVVSGGRTWRYVPVAADVNNYLRACAALNNTAPEGMTQACVRMFAKTVN